jgi:hypothetical protein
MGLSAYLDETRLNSLGDDQGRWRQYVLDHLDYIAGFSRKYEIDAPLINQFRYDLKRFLKEYLSLQEDIAWIVLLLNNMPNDFSFSEAGEYTIPNDQDIKKLYHTFATITSTIK